MDGRESWYGAQDSTTYGVVVGADVGYSNVFVDVEKDSTSPSK